MDPSTFWDSVWIHRVYIIWVNYNDLTTTSLEIMVSKGESSPNGLNSD